MDTDDENCPVCFSSLSGINYVNTACNHKICLGCFMKHTTNNNNCPLCRSILLNSAERVHMNRSQNVRSEGDAMDLNEFIELLLRRVNEEREQGSGLNYRTYTYPPRHRVISRDSDPWRRFYRPERDSFGEEDANDSVENSEIEDSHVNRNLFSFFNLVSGSVFNSR